MATLIACLSTGKGTWNHVSTLIAQEEWDKIFLVTNDFGKEKFSHDKSFELVLVDTQKKPEDLTNDIKSALEGKILDTEVALNFVSGSGNEHMAVLSAILKLGLGVRLVVAGTDKMHVM